jgi:2-phosphosulfolactate phosphatase
VLVGCLLNARAVARAAAVVAGERAITVVACGERWRERGEDGPLRVAFEDLIGAGAVIAALGGDRSPEARVAEEACQAMRRDLAALLAECGSGRELVLRGYAADVAHAARLDLYPEAPILEADGWLRAWRG